MRWLIDGQQSESVAASDRGLHYGDGLFETVAVRQGRLEFWSQHLNRLEAGCRRLGIEPPDREILLSEAGRLFTRQETGILKIIVTRGSGGRGYLPPASQRPRRIVSAHPWPDYPETLWMEGIQMRLCQTRLATQPLLAGLKHLNRLEQVLARDEWRTADIHEGVMCDSDGNVIEGVMSNLFLVRDGTLLTPDLSNCGVAGIIRQVVLEIAQALDIVTNIGTITGADLNRADELFVTNSVIGLWPVKALEAHRFDGGRISRTIAAELERRREAQSHPIP